MRSRGKVVGDDDARWWGYDSDDCARVLSAGLGWVEVALRSALEERERGVPTA